MDEKNLEAQTISDVIKRFEKLKAEYGDLPIYIDYDGEYQSFNSQEFVQDEDGFGKFIVIK